MYVAGPEPGADHRQCPGCQRAGVPGLSMDDGYGPDGPYGALIAAVLQHCSCEKAHAVAALKVSDLSSSSASLFLL